MDLDGAFDATTFGLLLAEVALHGVVEDGLDAELGESCHDRFNLEYFC